VSSQRGKLEKNKEKMETQRMIEFPHKNMDKRPRKRPRLTWDMPPLLPPPKVLLSLSLSLCVRVKFCGKNSLLMRFYSLKFRFSFPIKLMKNLPLPNFHAINC
jgi:hypothetical protein